MNYRVNTTTNQIIEDKGNLGAFFFSQDWRVATTSEKNAYKLKIAKKSKLKELKDERKKYKSTIIIKDDITLLDLEVGSNNYENLKSLKFGWTQEDEDLFDEEMNTMVGDKDTSNTYNYWKNLINNATSVGDLNSLIIKIGN